MESYNVGEVSASSHTANSFSGGIVGDGDAILTNNYNRGAIASHTNQAKAYLGGIAGTLSSATQSEMKNCYYKNDVLNAVGNGLGIPLSAYPGTDAQLRNKAFFVGFDFDATWGIGHGGYSHLQNLEEHFYTDGWETVVSATCQTEGAKTRKCAVCGKLKTGTVPILATHTPGTWKITEPASCATAGEETQKCSVCDALIGTRPLAKTDIHSFSTWKTTKAATCKAAGTQTRSCSVCGETETKTLAKLTAHSFSAWKTTKSATCKAAGTQTRTCSVCKETETQKLAKLTAHKAGAWVTTVKATTAKAGKQEQKCTVCGKLLAAKTLPANHTVKLNASKATLGKGETYTLKATASVKTTVKWTTSNAKAATVDSKGKVTAKAAGTATITAATAGGRTAKCTVTVKPAPSSVTLSKTSLTLGKGETYALKATLNSGAASAKNSWSSSDTKIATVDASGKITAKEAGTATITVKTFNGKTKSCKVTVKAAPTSVKLNKSTLTLAKGKAETLKVTLNPSGAASLKRTWTSSNTKIAKVDANGKVTAVAKGTTTITFRTYNGKTKSCKVTVK